MIQALKPYRKLVLVCTNERTDGRECCLNKGAPELHAKLKEAVKAVFTDVRVSRSGCLDNCKTGITVVIMPDNVWFGAVQEEDIPKIVDMLS